MQPHYYLMKNKKILRLEWNQTFESLPESVRARAFSEETPSMDQNQANWRVAIFRDEIMELGEFLEWMTTPEAMEEEILEYDLAN